MSTVKTNQREIETPNAIEELTLNETGADQVKGGAAIDYLLQIDGIKGESTQSKHERR